MIIDKINIISLKLLAIVNVLLSQAKKKLDIDTAVFSELAIMILIKDFYQFSPIIKKFLWEKVITTDRLYSKIIWNHFPLVIILTQQMKNQINKIFHNLLTRVRKSLLNNDSIDTLNSRIASSIPINNINKNIVIVQ